MRNRLIVGFFCLAATVFLLAVAIWQANEGRLGAGLMAIGIGLALLLAATSMLRSRRTRL